MKNYVQPGKRLATYNASSTVTAPGGHSDGRRQPHPHPARGHSAAVPSARRRPRKCSLLPAKSADTWADGATLYWDATNGWLTVESTSSWPAGAVGAKAGGVTVGERQAAL